jgi:ribulose-phosphate 3-epimerase
MDGHFVPNITMGPPVVAALKRVTSLPLDVHLMISEPDRYLESFVNAGATTVIVHVEPLPHLHRTLTRIRQLGAKAGVAINPSTPLTAVSEVLSEIDQLLVMSVNPGFGGQTFIPRTLHKITEARDLLREAGSTALIEVDGGVDEQNAGALTAAGAQILVAGASIYGTPDPARAVRALRDAAMRAVPR